MKKVLLHIHLDGSVRPDTVSELLNLDIDYVKSNMIAKNCSSLSDYLTKFDLPIKAMQTKDNLTRIAFELATDLKNDDVIYAEVRFAPFFHIKNGLTYDDVIISILEGFNRCSGIKINLLLCMMRGLSYEDNKDIIYLAKKYLGKGVVGIDLAGDEYKYKTSLYEDLFRLANFNNIPFTIHAGEADGASSIRDAIKYGAKRIGHGIRCVSDINLMELIKDKNILLEVCPSSNVQTGVVVDYVFHKAKFLFDNGIKICINTDNQTVSNVTVNEEYNRLKKYLEFSDEDLKKCNKYAIEGSFITKEEKEELIKEL